MNASSKGPDKNLTGSISSPLWLRIGFWACIVISVSVVIRRVLALANPPKSAPPLVAGLDAVFESHKALTLAHILPALILVLIVPFYFFGNSAMASEARRLIFPLGAIVGITAYAMSARPVGGWVELSAILFFNSLFLFSLAKACRHAQRREVLQERSWMLRAIVILLGIATTRPVMGVFFATARLTHLVPSQFFGIAFWIGFSINTAVVELWLYATRQKSPQLASNPAQG
jgi:hypothetical protein